VQGEINMYAIQWYDERSGTWLFCSTKDQLEIYHTFERASESCEAWRTSSVYHECQDEYRVVSVAVEEKS
jgi:hypothetical protein